MSPSTPFSIQHRLHTIPLCPPVAQPLLPSFGSSAPLSSCSSLLSAGGASSIWNDLDRTSCSDSNDASSMSVAVASPSGSHPAHCRMQMKHVLCPHPSQSAYESSSDFFVGLRWHTLHGASEFVVRVAGRFTASIWSCSTLLPHDGSLSVAALGGAAPLCCPSSSGMDT